MSDRMACRSFLDTDVTLEADFSSPQLRLDAPQLPSCANNWLSLPRIHGKSSLPMQMKKANGFHPVHGLNHQYRTKLEASAVAITTECFIWVELNFISIWNIFLSNAFPTPPHTPPFSGALMDRHFMMIVLAVVMYESDSWSSNDITLLRRRKHASHLMESTRQ